MTQARKAGATSVPRYDEYEPSSVTASRTKRANRAKDTSAELLLRQHLFRRGLRYRIHRPDLPGKPDIVFPGRKLVIFCDGDFWHGRNWEERRRKLEKGSNPTYWIPKIQRNIERGREQEEALRALGWEVVRLWETDILKDPVGSAEAVNRALENR